MRPTLAKARVRKYRGTLPGGIAPGVIWVPDTRYPDFAEECRRQSLLVDEADKADTAMQQLMDTALADGDGWTD